VISVSIEDFEAALTSVVLLGKFLKKAKGRFSKKQKKQLAETGTALVQLASAEEIGTYDTPMRQQIRHIGVARKKGAAMRRVTSKKRRATTTKRKPR
jgi:hypothetical protein